MKIRLNLATAPLESHRRFALGAALLGTVGLVALVGLSWHAYSVWQADRSLRADIAKLEKRMDQLRRERRDLELFFNKPEIHKLRDRSAFLNGLIEQRSFPWTKIFMDLERTLPEGVRVVSISPKMNEGGVEVKLVVGATGDESKLKFLRALEESKEFSRVQLQLTRPGRPGEADRVFLELTAWYSTT
jgi:Tfp pilus assembly protein PilN